MAHDCAGQIPCLGNSQPVNGCPGSALRDMARIALSESAGASMQAAGSSSPALNWATHWRRSAGLVGGEQG